MTERDKSSTLAAVLGIVLGILGTVLFFTVIGKPARMSGNYNNWRKLNLVLQEIQKCYVDTVDVKKVTDAAVVASLAALDPHSVYLPPVELEKSQTELAGNFDGIGIQFNVPNDTAIVLEVIPGVLPKSRTPAGRPHPESGLMQYCGRQISAGQHGAPHEGTCRNRGRDSREEGRGEDSFQYKARENPYALRGCGIHDQ